MRSTASRDTSVISTTPIIVLVVGVALMVGSLGVYVVPLQIGAWMDSLHVSATQSGLLGTLEVAAMSITAIVVAPKICHWSLSRTALVGALLSIAGQIITVGVSYYSFLLVVRPIVGVGCGLVFAAVVAAVATSPNPDRLMGFGQATMNLLFVGVFMLIPFALQWGGQSGLFVALVVLMLVSLPALFLLPGKAVADSTASRPPMVSALRVTVHFVAIIVLNTGLGALWGFLERAGTQIGLSQATIGSVFSASALAMIVGSLLAGWLGVRVGRAMPMLLSAWLCGVAALIAMTAQTLPVYALGVMIYGVAYLFLGPYMIVGMSSALDSSGRLAAASGGAMFLSYSVGIGSGGYIADTFSYAAIGWVGLIGCSFSGILFFANARQSDAKIAS